MKATQRAILRDVYRAAQSGYAWPGGYPLLVIMVDGEVCCAACAKAEFRQIADATLNRDSSGWQAAGVDAFYEGGTLECCNCGAPIESAYGDPEGEV